VLSTAVFLPESASAFWPFSTNANAATNTSIPGSRPSVLAAAINYDPNPNKGLGDLQMISDNALMSHDGPNGTINDVATSMSSDRISVYVVRAGDTLGEIAVMFGVSINTIKWANDLTSTTSVHPGDTLIILPVSGVKRTVVKGDTLKSIAKKYGADADEVATFNGLDSSEPLAIGSQLIIPGAEFTPSTPLKKNTPRKISEPYLGGGGSVQFDYYSNPMPGALVTQGIHGWNGVDLGAPRGTPIRAAADGIVIIARSGGGWNGGYGNYVVITHGNGSQTLYGHMKNLIVSSGQSVSSGQIIGYEGSTGESTGPHLHFEVRGAANPFRMCAVGTVCSPQ